MIDCRGRVPLGEPIAEGLELAGLGLGNLIAPGGALGFAALLLASAAIHGNEKIGGGEREQAPAYLPRPAHLTWAI